MLPEAFAIIRESMDRHIGIRQIFNPDENFDPDRFDDETLETVRQRAAQDDQRGLELDARSDPGEDLRGGAEALSGQPAPLPCALL